MFSYKWGNSSRLWFPCIDSLSEICTWKIEVTADPDMVVVCPGDLAEKVYNKPMIYLPLILSQTSPAVSF